MPISFILDHLLASSRSSDDNGKTTLHLQDYNLLVLQLVTLPNLLLAALPYLPPDSLREAEDAPDVEAVVPDLNAAGHLTITQSVKDAFKRILSDHGVDLEFTYGHWAGLATNLKKEKKRFDLILTAETIYAEESVDDLVSVLRAVSSKQADSDKVEVELEDTFGRMSMKEDWPRDLSNGEGVVLVAAKVSLVVTG